MNDIVAKQVDSACVPAPAAVVARLDQAMRAALNDPAIVRRIEEFGSIPA